MQLIHELLSRYTNFVPPDMVVRKKLSIILTDELHTPVSERDIRIIGPVAYCTFGSAIKNSLFLKKNSILSQLEKEFGKQIIRDIQ
jgi:hypothetical protein